jgi:hypothetical protein
MDGQEVAADAAGTVGEAGHRGMLTLTMREMFEMAHSMGVKLSTIV